MKKNENEYIEANNISLKDLSPDYAMIKSLDKLKEELNKDEEN